MADADVVLTINGRKFSGWESIRITRGLKECAGSFDISVSERWAGQTPPSPWQILPFNTAVVSIGGTPVITGYLEHYDPSYGPNEHSVRVAGRSKTCDLIDCMPDVGSGEFSGYTLDRIARALCAPFGIGVVVQADMGDPLPDATLEKTETAYSFLEKLARLRSVLLTDDASGNLVLTQAGNGGAAGALVEGENILTGKAKLSANQRFQTYVVLSQTPLAFDGDDAQTQIAGQATDPGCIRYRRYAEMAENPADKDQAGDRAKWRALHNCASGTEAVIEVQGFHQPDGSLWDINKLVPVNSSMLALERQLLIAKMVMTLDAGGSRTELTVAPQEAYTPGASGGGSKTKAKGKTADIWADAISIKKK